MFYEKKRLNQFLLIYNHFVNLIEVREVKIEFSLGKQYIILRDWHNNYIMNLIKMSNFFLEVVDKFWAKKFLDE